MLVGAYLASVDRLLARGHGLFPASGGGGLKVDGGGGPPPPPAPGGGALTDGVTAAGGDYQRSRAGAEALDADIQQAADDGSGVGQSGRTNAGLVHDTAKAQAAAITPATNSPAGVRLLVSTMDQRVADMQRQIQATNAENRLLAVRLRQLAASYQAMSLTGMGGRFPMSGFGGGGLGGLSGLAATPASMVSQLGRFDGGAGAAPAALVGRAVGGVLPVGDATGSEAGLQKDTILARRAVSAAFPQITEIGGVRADSLKWHPNGQAIDVMLPKNLVGTAEGKALGDQIVKFALQHGKQFNLNHICWQQTLINPDGSSSPMENRGGATANHMDHVHLATSGGGFPHGGEVYRL